MKKITLFISITCFMSFENCIFQKDIPADSVQNDNNEFHTRNKMLDTELKCAKAHYYIGYEDEVIVCATNKRDMAHMHHLYEDALKKMSGRYFKTEEEYREAFNKIQPKFHIIYPLASLNEIQQMENAYRELVTYAATFEVQFIEDIPNNESEKYIYLNVKSDLPYSRLIFTGTKTRPTIVSNLMIYVNADIVILNHLSFVHRLPGSAIKADVGQAFLSHHIIFENVPERPPHWKFIEEPLISVYSTQNTPYNVTIENSVFKNNHSESILGTDAASSQTMKTITLSNVEMIDNDGSFDISATESALIDSCRIAQHKPASAFILRTHNTNVTIRNSKLSGFVMKYDPLPNQLSEQPKPIAKTNNTEEDDTKYHGWQ